MKDAQIRAALKLALLAQYGGDPDTVIIDELGLRHGSSRIDLVAVNGDLHGFEIKSDQDTLTRLPNQARIYNSVLDSVTLVAGGRHVGPATHLVPEWWGIQVAEAQGDDRVFLRELRLARTNPAHEPLAIAKLLWRDEALEFLEELGEAKGFHSKPRGTIYSRLVMVTTLDQVRARVRRQLKDRVNWRAAGRQVSCGG